MNIRSRLRILLVLSLCLIECPIFTTPLTASEGPVPGERPRYTIKARYPHDPQAFTQGLEYRSGYLYESTGLNGHSSLRKVDLKTGKVLKELNLPSQYFGEGLTVLNGKIFQLTWQNKVGFIYKLNTFEKVGEFHYDWEGWGLTNDGRYLIASDGSNKMRFIDPRSFKTVRSIDVFSNGRPLRELNELEYVNGVIYSNIWHSKSIAEIDAKTGNLRGLIDFTGIDAGLQLGSEDVLNGIAYDPKSKNLIITGKRWPTLFVVNLSRKPVQR